MMKIPWNQDWECWAIDINDSRHIVDYMENKKYHYWVDEDVLSYNLIAFSRETGDEKRSTRDAQSAPGVYEQESSEDTVPGGNSDGSESLSEKKPALKTAVMSIYLSRWRFMFNLIATGRKRTINGPLIV